MRIAAATSERIVLVIVVLSFVVCLASPVLLLLLLACYCGLLKPSVLLGVSTGVEALQQRNCDCCHSGTVVPGLVVNSKGNGMYLVQDFGAFASIQDAW
jgi:hypothetical protein